MKTRTISTYQGAAPAPATNLVVDNQNRRVRINKIEGYCVGATAQDNAQYFIQIFALSAVPINGSIPLRSLQVTANLGFTFDYLEQGIDVSQLAVPPNVGNCILVLSTTEATLTVATGNIKMDCSVDIEEYETQPVNTTTVGDQVTAVASLQVWAEAANPTPSALLQVIAKNNSGGTQYLMLFAKDAPALGDAPIQVWTLTNGQQKILNFGDANAGTATQTADKSAAGTVRRGCSLFASSTPYTLTAAAANWNMQATYRVLP